MTELLVLHHSHTDVGYTELQSRIERRHADFLRQAVAIADRRPEFRWVAETFWGVERFLERTDEVGRKAFTAAVRAGSIGLSASWANFNELIDAELLTRVTARAVAFGREIGVPVRSAMTADVNGNGWAFAAALAANGVSNLFTCVHTHHGRYPLDHPMQAFLWEAPDGAEILVISGEHYHFGNELGIVPGAVSSYLTKDECDASTIYHDHWKVATIRIPRYLEALGERGWPFDFVPVMASGLRTDNGPPNEAILDFIDRWNGERGDVCTLAMATLDEVFERVRAAGVDLPVHRGDWPDWWSDGPASRPAGTRIYRKARRDLARLEALDPEADTAGIEENLALYAEHTFSHSDSVNAPWHPLVEGIATAKTGYAAAAAQEACDRLDAACEARGAAVLDPEMPLRWRAINPTDRPLTGIAPLFVGHYEYHERGLDTGAEVEGDDVAVEGRPAPGGIEFCVPVELSPREERVIALVRGDSFADEKGEPGVLETQFVRVTFREGAEIESFLDKRAGRELLRPDRRHGAFTPIYEVTPDGERGPMLLNRKGETVKRTAAPIRWAARPKINHVFARAKLGFTVPGAARCEMDLIAHHAEPRVDVVLRIHKESVADPENLYLSLPFGTKDLVLDRGGIPVRPRVQQIPGTLTDYYTVGAGFATEGVAVSMPDASLLWLGPLEYGERRLAGDPGLDGDPALPYAWLMNNFWETNFDASLGGFHQFRFTVRFGPEYAVPDEGLGLLRAHDTGLVVFRMRRDA